MVEHLCVELRLIVYTIIGNGCVCGGHFIVGCTIGYTTKSNCLIMLLLRREGRNAVAKCVAVAKLRCNISNNLDGRYIS